MSGNRMKQRTSTPVRCTEAAGWQRLVVLVMEEKGVAVEASSTFEFRGRWSCEESDTTGLTRHTRTHTQGKEEKRRNS